MATEEIKDRPILITGLAVSKLEKEQTRLRANGLRMSLSALASKAIIETFKD